MRFKIQVNILSNNRPFRVQGFCIFLFKVMKCTVLCSLRVKGPKIPVSGCHVTMKVYFSPLLNSPSDHILLKLVSQYYCS